MVHGISGPPSMRRYNSGCYPTVLRSRNGEVTWGVEGIVFSAGSCVQWLCDLGLIRTVDQSDALASSVDSSEGVDFVPAFSGLGTPRWTSAPAEDSSGSPADRVRPISFARCSREWPSAGPIYSRPRKAKSVSTGGDSTGWWHERQSLLCPAPR